MLEEERVCNKRVLLYENAEFLKYIYIYIYTIWGATALPQTWRTAVLCSEDQAQWKNCSADQNQQVLEETARTFWRN